MRHSAMFTIGLTIACLLTAGGNRAAAQGDDLDLLADRWGRMHGAAIFCKIQTAHDFGLMAVDYFRMAGRFDSLREVYGLALLNASHTPPARDIGGDCEGLRAAYTETWEMLKRETGR